MEILKINPNKFKKITEESIKSIKKGKVIICPTDTVYGLICDATNKKAVERVFKIKKRPKEKPIPIFVKNIKMAKKLARMDENQEKFLKSVWPGRVTVVLTRLRSASARASADKQGFGLRPTKSPSADEVGGQRKKKLYGVDKKTIALRIPNYKLVIFLLKKLNRPLTGTSANISGKPASTEIKKVINQFKNRKYQPDLVINAGNLPPSKPSIVLDLIQFPPKILRQ